MVAARQAAHVHIQQLKIGLVVMMSALAVLSEDLVQRVLHLFDILMRTCIQRLLHHRLLRARLASKGVLQQGRIGSQARVDFYQPVGTGQQADKGIIELVSGRMFDGFLPDLYLRADRVKQLELAQFHSNGCQRSTAGKMLRLIRATLVHEGGSPLA